MAEPERQPERHERYDELSERERQRHRQEDMSMRRENEARREPELRRERDRDFEARREPETVREGPWRQAMAAPAASMPVAHISWSSIFAGLAIALVTQIVLSAIGGAIGLTLGPGQAVTTALGIWAAVSGLIALFLGGWIAARTAAFGSIGTGILHGILVWSLFFITAAVLGAAGVPAILGIVTPPTITLGQAATATGFALLGMGLSLAAAIIGGIVGGIGRRNQMAIMPEGRTGGYL